MKVKEFLTLSAAAVGVLVLLLAVSLLTAWGTARLVPWGRVPADPPRPAPRPQLALQAPPAEAAPPGTSANRPRPTSCE
jgi:hypothetical protein